MRLADQTKDSLIARLFLMIDFPLYNGEILALQNERSAEIRLSELFRSCMI